MNRRGLLIGGIAGVSAVTVGLIGSGAFAPSEPAGDTPPQPGAGVTTMTPDIVLGSPDAPVRIVEYGSFTCVHCAAFHRDVYPRLKADYIDTGKVSFVFREVYFDRYGLWAGILAACGGEARYYGLAEMLFARRDEWVINDPVQASAALKTIGLSAGIEGASIDACMQDADLAQRLVDTFQTRAAEDSITATPTFIIDGVTHQNMGYDGFRSVLEAHPALAG